MWVVVMMVGAYCLINSHSSLRPMESTPAVGSSSTKTYGLLTSEQDNESLRF